MAISIAGIDKAEVLAALYNASRRQGMGFMHARGATGMSVEEARELLAKTTYFDYLHGRGMKIDLTSDLLEDWLYDRDNGQGAAARALAPLRAPQAGGGN